MNNKERTAYYKELLALLDQIDAAAAQNAHLAVLHPRLDAHDAAAFCGMTHDNFKKSVATQTRERAPLTPAADAHNRRLWRLGDLVRWDSLRRGITL